MVDFKEFDEEEFIKVVKAFVSMGFSKEEAERLAQTAELMRSISELTPDDQLSNAQKIKDATYNSGIVIGNVLKQTGNSMKEVVKMIDKDYQKFLNNLYARLENEHVIEKLSNMISHRISEYDYSPKEIIEYIKDEWDFLTKKEQQKLGVLIVGHNQLNKFLVLMHNYDDIMGEEDVDIADEISDSNTVGKHDKLHYQALKENEAKDELSKATVNLTNAMNYILENYNPSDISLPQHVLINESHMKNELIEEVKKFPLWMTEELNKIDTEYAKTTKGLADSISKAVHSIGLNFNNNKFNYGDDLIIDDSYIVRTTSEQVMIYKRLH